MSDTGFNLESEPSRNGLTLLLILPGLADSGGVASLAGQHILGNHLSRKLGGFNSDAIYDYRQHRGSARLDGGMVVEALIPAVTLHEVQDAHGHPFLLMFGPEPDLRWGGFTEALLELIRQQDMRTVISVGGVSWGTPHTRPIGVMAHGTDPFTVAQYPYSVPTASFPVSIQSLLESRAMEAGFESMEFIARVPQYLSHVSYPKATVAVLDAAAAYANLNLSTGILIKDDSESQLNAYLQAMPPLAALVSTLEIAHDQEMPLEASMLPSGDELAKQIEEYLSNLQ
jgi:hypothetical protein